MTEKEPDPRWCEEPWGFGEIESESVCLRSGTGDVIHRPRPAHGPQFTHGELARIVACVNACAGIPTPALESGAIAEMREALAAGRQKLATYVHVFDSGVFDGDKELRSALVRWDAALARLEGR